MTLPLTGLALLLATGLGVPLGLYAAYRRGGAADALVSGLAQLGMATPSFWLGIFLILVFAVRLNWLPAGGFPGWSAGASTALRALLLPAAARGAARAASLTRMVRAALDVMGRDFVRTARRQRRAAIVVMRRHVLRNALITISTVLVLELGQLLAGAVIIEQVFARPGLGKPGADGRQRQRPASHPRRVVVIAGAIVFLSFVNDVLYAYLDPGSDTHDGQRPDRGRKGRRTARPSMEFVRGRGLGGPHRGHGAGQSRSGCPTTPSKLNVLHRFQGPGAEHWLGTDQFGRELFSRILAGARTTLAVGVAAVGFGVTFGAVIGGGAASSAAGPTNC